MNKPIIGLLRAKITTYAGMYYTLVNFFLKHFYLLASRLLLLSYKLDCPYNHKGVVNVH